MLTPLLAMMLTCPSPDASSDDRWSHVEQFDNGGKALVRMDGEVNDEWRGKKKPRKAMRIRARKGPRAAPPTPSPPPAPEVAPTPAPTPDPAPAPRSPDAGVAVKAWEVEVLDRVNEHRAEGAYCGGSYHAPVGPLKLEARLQLASIGHSQDMLFRQFVGHANPDGASPFDRMDDVGYRYLSAGENVAAGQRSPEEVVADWMSSPGHCRNIMSGKFTETGISYVRAEGGDRFGHYWTQKFGRR